MQYKKVTGFSVAILLIIGGLLFQTQRAFEPRYKKIIFSDTQYPELQKQLAVLIDSEYGELSPQDISIALVDLNDDGMKEIIAFVVNSQWGGSGGYYTPIYGQDGDHLRVLWDGGNTYGGLAILSHRTAGYHDIASFAEGFPVGSEQYYKHILVWDDTKNHYEYAPSMRITKKEMEFFLNENHDA